MEPAIADRAFPRAEPPRRSALGYGDFDTVMDVLARAATKGPHLMGEQFTAADVVIGSTLRWGMMFNLLPKRKEFVDYVDRLQKRPALQRVTALDQSSPRRNRGSIGTATASIPIRNRRPCRSSDFRHSLATAECFKASAIFFGPSA